MSSSYAYYRLKLRLWTKLRNRQALRACMPWERSSVYLLAWFGPFASERFPCLLSWLAFGWEGAASNHPDRTDVKVKKEARTILFLPLACFEADFSTLPRLERWLVRKDPVALMSLRQMNLLRQLDKPDKAQHCNQALLPALCIASTCDLTMLLSSEIGNVWTQSGNTTKMQSYLELLNSDDIFALFKSERKLGTNFFQWNCSVCVPKAAYRGENVLHYLFQIVRAAQPAISDCVVWYNSNSWCEHRIQYPATLPFSWLCIGCYYTFCTRRCSTSFAF